MTSTKKRLELSQSTIFLWMGRQWQARMAFCRLNPTTSSIFTAIDALNHICSMCCFRLRRTTTLLCSAKKFLSARTEQIIKLRNLAILKWGLKNCFGVRSPIVIYSNDGARWRRKRLRNIWWTMDMAAGAKFESIALQHAKSSKTNQRGRSKHSPTISSEHFFTISKPRKTS